MPTADLYAAERAAYQENLDVCLDGRFSAFCDHAQLTADDAARVREAEYQANLVTCIDPEWQHLCRSELLPATVPSTGHAPSTPASPSSSSLPAPPAAAAPRCRARRRASWAPT